MPRNDGTRHARAATLCQAKCEIEATDLLLDACHSAGLSTEGTRDLDNNLTNQYLKNLLYQEHGRAIITSSDVNEKSR